MPTYYCPHCFPKLGIGVLKAERRDIGPIQTDEPAEDCTTDRDTRYKYADRVVPTNPFKPTRSTDKPTSRPCTPYGFHRHVSFSNRLARSL
ncbi:15202_t:CDS:2 [Acaulospora morrowiae]|uniref:15202_t:CDS:1 n=1 Tax=Acaulospora morrowiae TaxID=94023 RepID=A0A9N9BLD0_9GLOM|nr:15202_t:CDS:2 [Acaulospora morrowiae]